MVRQFRRLKRSVRKQNDGLSDRQLLNDIGMSVFQEAQANCPVKTGRLKESANFVQTSDGWRIEYTAPYAMEVHNGVREKPKPNPYESNVRGHTRNGVYVRPHLRTQKRDVKPMFISGLNTWRNIDTTKPMKANGWLEKAYQKIKGQLPYRVQKQLPQFIVRGTRNGY